ncbi:hypothetical protein AB0N76_25720, partial [Kitasatospora sp. NPDC093806]
MLLIVLVLLLALILGGAGFAIHALWWIALVVRAAEAGHRVVGYDVDERRIKRLAVGESYVE